jgi:hypothetical protein
VVTPKLLAAGAATSVIALLLVFNAVTAANSGVVGRAAALAPSSAATLDKIDIVSNTLFKTNLPTGGVNAYIVGEVKNNNDHPVGFVNLGISLFDSSGKKIGNNNNGPESTFTYLEELKAGQKAPFKFSIFDKNVASDIDSYRIKVLSSQDNGSPGKPELLKIKRGDEGIDSNKGWFHLLGQVVNTDSKTTQSFTKAVATFYDRNGKVLDAAFSYTEPTALDKAKTGLTGIYKILSLMDKSTALKVTKFTLVAESDHATSKVVTVNVHIQPSSKGDGHSTSKSSNNGNNVDIDIDIHNHIDNTVIVKNNNTVIVVNNNNIGGNSNENQTDTTDNNDNSSGTTINDNSSSTSSGGSNGNNAAVPAENDNSTRSIDNDNNIGGNSNENQTAGDDNSITSNNDNGTTTTTIPDNSIGSDNSTSTTTIQDTNDNSTSNNNDDNSTDTMTTGSQGQQQESPSTTDNKDNDTGTITGSNGSGGSSTNSTS